MHHRSLPFLLSCIRTTAAIRVEFNVPTNIDDLAAFGHPIHNEVCDPVISLVQVQDSTATFEDFIAALAELHIIEDLVAGLKDTYGAAEYGMATFGDKPAPIHGYGRGWGLWQPGFDSSTWSPDECYTAHLSLQTLTDSTPIWDAVKISGGKDFEENQFDALGKAAVDPFFWEHASENSRHARIAMLITDDFSHLSGSRSADIGQFGFKTTYRETQRHYNMNFGSFSEDSSVFRIVEDLGSATLKWPIGPAGSEVNIKGNDAYRSFIICHDSEGMGSIDYRKDILVRLSGSGADIGTTDIEVPAQTKAWWEAFCAREYDAFTEWNFDGVFKWVNQYKFIEESAIKDYRYDDMAVDTDMCTDYEYPDVSDVRYGDMFKKNGVIPTVILIPQLPASEFLMEVVASSALANHCPKVRKSCLLSSDIPDFCFASWGGDWDDNIIREKYYDCIQEEYLGALQNHTNIPWVFILNDGDSVDAKELGILMRQGIDEVIGNVFCPDPTTTPVVPTTATKPTITTATLTTMTTTTTTASGAVSASGVLIGVAVGAGCAVAALVGMTCCFIGAVDDDDDDDSEEAELDVAGESASVREVQLMPTDLQII